MLYVSYSADVESALAHPDVQVVLARGGTAVFLPHIDDAGASIESTLRTGTAVIEWQTCQRCVASPAGLAHLHAVLVGVMMNRRLRCP